MYDNLDQWLKAELHGFAPPPTQKEPAGQLLTVLRQVGADHTSEAAKAKGAEGLKRVHAFAKGLLERWTWDDEITLALEGCVVLRPRQADRAIELHEDLAEYVIESIKGCGGLPMEFVGLLEAIKDFVYPLGWDYTEGWTAPGL